MTRLRWVRCSGLGWLLGIPLIVLGALAGESAGLGGAQFFVGAGVGAGVGLLQARELRNVLPETRRWIVSTTLGLSAPFLAADLAGLIGLSSIYSLYVSVMLGGLLVGARQSRILGIAGKDARGWIARSVLGWSLAAGTAGLADLMVKGIPLRGLIGLFTFLGVVASGGLVLGAVTGPPPIRKVGELAAD